MFVEDIGRPGFSGILAEEAAADAAARKRQISAAERPGALVPVAISAGARDDGNRLALESFQRWLADERDAARS